MNTFMAILSQLFWGVTVGALSTAFLTLAQGGLLIAALCGAGWFGFRWSQDRRKDRGE